MTGQPVTTHEDLLLGLLLLQHRMAETLTALERASIGSPSPEPADANDRLMRLAEDWLLRVVRAAWPFRTSTVGAPVDADQPFERIVVTISFSPTRLACGRGTDHLDIDLINLVRSDVFPWQPLLAALRRRWPAGAIVYALTVGLSVDEIHQVAHPERLATLGALLAHAPIPIAPEAEPGHIE